MESPAKTKKHWLVLFSVCLLYAGNLGLGANTFGIYYTPVSESLGIFRGDFAMNTTIAALVSGIFALFIPKILEKMGWKKSVAVGSILTAVSILAMGLTKNVWVFNGLGVLRGIGLALTTFVSGAALINQWFREKNGLAISLATSFSGLASILFSPVFSRLILSIGWQGTFMIHGILAFLFCLPAMLYPFTFNPQDEGLMPYGASKEELIKETEEKEQGPVRPKDYLGLSFFALVLMATLQTGVVGINQHLPSYGLIQGLSAEGAGLLLSGAMLGNMMFKLLAGVLNDYIGGIKTMLVIMGLNLLALFALIFWTNPLALIFHSWLYGAVFGTAVLYVVLSKQFFGLRAGTHVYSAIIFSASLAIAVSNAGVGYLYDFIGTYIPAFWFGILFQILSVFLLFVAMKFAPAQLKK